MTTRRKRYVSTAVAIAAGLAAAPVLADDSDGADAQAVDTHSHSSLAANVYFTDDKGNRRNPTAEELIVASEGFQEDLERIVGKNNKNREQQTTHANGSTSAVVALSKLSYLVAETDENGNLVIRHGTVAEDGEVAAPRAPELPEM